MIAAAPIDIPAGTLRRSFVLDKMVDVKFGLKWRGILHQLAPGKAAGVNPLDPMECYRALWKHVATLFPLTEVDLDYCQEMAEEYEADGGESASRLAWLDHEGMPVSVLGVDHEDFDFGNSPCIAYCMLVAGDISDHWVTNVHKHDLLGRHHKRLAPFIERGFADRLPVAPRGRKWTSPWEDLDLLVRYVRGRIGSHFLDWSYMMVMEAGGFPDWNVDEIRGFARDWKQTEPFWKNICALRDYIDARPAERLPLLAGALAGDSATLQQLTEPKPGRGKTLAKLFARGRR